MREKGDGGGRRPRGGLLALSVAGLWVGGCVAPPPEAELRLVEVRRQGAELELSLDTLEERLLSGQSSVALWSELAQRHREVSELACANQESHAYEMVTLMERQQEKVKRLRRGRLARAPVEGGMGGPVSEQAP